VSNLESLQNAYGQMAVHYTEMEVDRDRWRKLAVRLANAAQSRQQYIQNVSQKAVDDLAAAIAAVRAAQEGA
jgi:hypothetical protein